MRVLLCAPCWCGRPPRCAAPTCGYSGPPCTLVRLVTQLWHWPFSPCHRCRHAAHSSQLARQQCCLRLQPPPISVRVAQDLQRRAEEVQADVAYPPAVIGDWRCIRQ
eukprot:1213542-Prymnesium_polylepis.1